MFMKKNFLLLLILISILALFSFVDSNYSERVSLRFSNEKINTSPGDAEGWRERIDKIGGEKAHEEFAKSVYGLREEVQHDFMHGFAGVLYEEKGIDGFTVCDSQFFYACFHEYGGRATSELGIESALKLNDLCLQTFDGNEADSCQHGIGHGLQSTYGYTQEDLDNSLAECSKLPSNGISGSGCYGGIFMEYNLRTMLSDEGEVRKSEDIFSPCNRVAEKFQEACFYWQPQWWRAGPLVTSINIADIYSNMGNSCREMIALLGDSEDRRKELRRSCFGGIGGISAPDAEFDTSYTAELCDAAASDVAEQAICRANAAYRTVETPDIETALCVCEGLTRNSLLYCRAFAESDYDKTYEISEAMDIY